MEDMPIPGQLDRQIDRFTIFQPRGVARRPFAPLLVVLVDLLEFCADYARMEIIQSAIEPKAVNIARVRAVIAQLAHLGIDFSVIGHQRAAIAECAKVFLNNKAGRGRVAELANGKVRSTGADRLRIVFDNSQLVTVGNSSDSAHVGALAVEMHRDDGLGSRSDSRFDLGGVYTL